MRSPARAPKLLGYGGMFPPAPVRHARTRPAHENHATLPPVLPRFGGGFPRMTGMTQRLQVCFVCKQLPITAVRLDVVNIRCADTETAPRTRSAEWLLCKLLRPNRFPSGACVQLVPCLRFR